MRRHDAGQHGVEPAIRRRVVGQDGLERAVIHRDIGVGIGLDEAMPREMLAAVGDPSTQQAVHQALGQQRDDTRIGMKSAVADHAAFAPVEVEHGRETEVDAARPQLRAEHVACCRRRIGRGHRTGALPAAAVAHPHLA